MSTDYVLLTADFFGPDTYLLYIIDKSSILNGGTATVTSELITGQQSMGIPVVGEYFPTGHTEMTPDELHEDVVVGSRVIAELGADAIKTFHTNNFTAVSGSCPVPVLALGAENASPMHINAVDSSTTIEISLFIMCSSLLSRERCLSFYIHSYSSFLFDKTFAMATAVTHIRPSAMMPIAGSPSALYNVPKSSDKRRSSGGNLISSTMSVMTSAISMMFSCFIRIFVFLLKVTLLRCF